MTDGDDYLTRELERHARRANAAAADHAALVAGLWELVREWRSSETHPDHASGCHVAADALASYLRRLGEVG